MTKDWRCVICDKDMSVLYACQCSVQGIMFLRRAWRNSLNRGLCGPTEACRNVRLCRRALKQHKAYYKLLFDRLLLV